ncbi:Pkinase-domain-containing protein [Macrolepiota fuliginosa MF-IS2]|uniref:Pkinase-domain-containing protein n=1 Tax=Macrolepiota fuliginosa MF-IS2 TaxID=1400762 RepID=A0A9P6C7Y4_9AGAR|nr:Pkinase-domain-containing protein [Macrolepiota fuliginosa MF-IS2]
MSPLPKLKPLPNPHHPSGGVSELSELFKTASIDDGFAYTLPTALLPSNGPDSQQESITVAPRPINPRHLSKGRLSSSEINPFFSTTPSPHSGPSYNTRAHLHSSKFPRTHRLNLHFVELYQLEDELGAGGYGFVMTARQRLSGQEVAVKFIIKEKVPEHAWMEDELLGRLPTEIALLNTINHQNVVKFLDLFEDNIYFYLVQELHGSPWQNCEEEDIREIDSLVSTPSLSPSASERSLDSSEPATPPPTTSSHLINSDTHTSTNSDPSHTKQTSTLFQFKRPEITRRASHDLFECIEQSEEKRLPEAQSRYVFAQVVDVVHHLDSLGIAHRDIKDENLVIDKNLKVKLIDFGSACAIDPTKPRPYYTQFFGTAAYASAEILLKKKYQAAPAEIWTLGVLLSYLLTGTSPFPSMRDAIEGKVTITDVPDTGLPEEAVDLMRRCLDPNPETRITIQQVKEHPWLKSSTPSLL